MKHILTPLKKLLPILLSVITTLSMAQTGTVIGKILSDTKEGLIGATAKIKGTTLGAAADMDGNFTILNVPIGEQKIIVNYIGYVSKEVKFEVEKGMNEMPAITLKEDNKLLNEVVVVGYGTQVRKDISSSISSVKGDDIKGQPVYNFASALQGKAAGVQVTTDAGVAGSGVSVRVRGPKTLSNSAEPLYVIDGIPLINYDNLTESDKTGYNVSPLSSINPNDIEDIQILKDAAATAIYGARGSNGVVLITTKSGKSGKTKVDFSYSTGISGPAHKMKLLDGPQWMSMYKEAWKNDTAAGLISKNTPFRLPNGVNPDSVANTNWVDKMFRMGSFQDASVSVNGGNEKTNFYTSLGIRDDKPFLVGNKFQRVSFRANVNHDGGKYFNIGMNNGITYTSNTYISTSFAGGLGTAQSSMLPIYNVKNSDGSYFLGGANPVAQIALKQAGSNTWRSINSIYLEIKIAKFLKFRVDGGIDLLNQEENFYTPTAIADLGVAKAEQRRDQYLTLNGTATLAFTKEVKKDHQLDAVIGFNPTKVKETFTYVSQTGFPTSSFTQPQGGTVTYGTGGTGHNFASVSAFSRFNYKYKNRHLFQASYRTDASSRWSPDKRWGHFPAFAYGWIMSEEDFFKKQKVLTFFKLRTNVGLTGNSEFSDDFAYMTGYNGGQNYNGSTGIGTANTAVKNLTWETTMKTGVGLDYAFLNSRISGMVDFYYEKTSNMLVKDYPLAPSSGFSSVTKNVGSLQNMGVDIQLTTNNFKPSSKFQWKTVVNVSVNRNKVLSLGDVKEVAGTSYGDNRAIVGQPVGVWYIAEYAGIDKATGALMIYDSAHNKIVANSTNSVKYRKTIGRPYPLFTGGITNSFSFHGFDLDVFCTFSVGNNIYDDAGKRQLGNMAYSWNQDARIVNRWQNPGDDATVQKLSTVTNYDFNTSKFLYDGSFLRLRTVTLGYNFPQTWLTKMKMRSMRIYVSGQNLAVATKYKGWDPETNRSSSGAITQSVTYLATPQARTFIFGINFGL